MTTIEFAVREALHDLADESGRAPGPANLAGPALCGAHRARVHRRTTAAVAAVLSTLVMAGTALLQPPAARERPAAPPVQEAPAPPPRGEAPVATFLTAPGPPAEITAGWKLLAGPHPDGGTIVYDRTNRRYRLLEPARVSLAPAGSLTAWFDSWGRLHMLDLAGGAPFEVKGAPPSAYGPPALDWTPDGARFLYTGMSNSGPVTVLVDAAARRARTVGEPFECRQRCEATWSADHTQVHVPQPQTDTRTYRAEDGVYVEERGGDGSYPASPHAASEWGSLWRKPDGRIVVKRGTGVTTGPCTDPFGGYWVGVSRLLCVEERRLTLRNIDGGSVTDVPYPVPFTIGDAESTVLGRG